VENHDLLDPDPAATEYVEAAPEGIVGSHAAQRFFRPGLLIGDVCPTLHIFMYSSASVRYIPNALTVFRILLTPLVLVLCTIPTLAAQGTAVVVFMCASASDYYDGVLARRMGARSRLGQFLDPLADKVLVLSVFGMLAIEEPYIVPWWAVLLIAGRDVLVTALRSWAEAHGRTLRTFRIAKGKTLLQLAFLFGMLVLRAAAHLPPPVSDGARWLLRETAVPFFLLILVVAFTVGTGLLYLVASEEEAVRSDS